MSDILSLLSSFLSLGLAVAALWISIRTSRDQKSSSVVLSHLSEIVEVESRLADIPDALRFHCVKVGELEEVNLTPKEFAYLLNSFTLGSVRHQILHPEDRDPFPADNYRYRMCQSEATRRAWPVIKKLMSPSAFMDRVDRTIREIEGLG